MLRETFEELERKGISTFEEGLEIKEIPLCGNHKLLYSGFGSQISNNASVKFGDNYIDAPSVVSMLYTMTNGGKIYKDALYKAIENGESVAIDLNLDRAAEADNIVAFIEQLLTKDEIDLTDFFDEHYLNAIINTGGEELSKTIKVNPNFSMNILYKVKNCPTI